MKQLRLKFFSTFFILALLIFSCGKEDERPTFPTSADIFFSVNEENNKKVAFTALAHSVDTYLWDFGDGETSTDENPVHEYSGGGYYTATLSVAGGSGTADASVQLAIDLTPYVLLTGGATAENGKTWKLNAAHSENDYFANADAELSTFLPAFTPLPAGVFGLLGLSEAYEDEFTFYFDGSYSHDLKEDGAGFSGIVNQLATTGGANVVNWSDDTDFGLCIATYAAESGATFTYEENVDFDVPSVYDPSDGIVTYSNVSTLDFSGTEFIGLQDAQRKVIVQNVTDASMRLVMFLAGSPDYFPMNTNALVLTFEVVKK